MPIMNESLNASSGSIFMSSIALVVIPDLLTPGRAAMPWTMPMIM